MKSGNFRNIGVFLIFLILVWTYIAYAGNFNWFQTDWSGGATSDISSDPTDPIHVARHPGDQSGWNKFYSMDSSVSVTTPGEVSISRILTPLIDTEFIGGVLDNVEVAGGPDTYLKLKDYMLDTGTGADGDLVIDGKTASNNTDGLTHPRRLATPANLTFSDGSGGSLGSGRYYYYRVVAYNSAGESTPVTGRYYLGSGNSVILNWDSVPCADGYRVYGRGASSADQRYGPLATIPATQTTWTDDGSQNGIFINAYTTGGMLSNGSYFYKVTGINRNNEETTIGLVGTYLPNTTTGRIVISWNSVEWAQGYRVYGRARNQGGTFGLLTSSPVLNTTWEDTGVDTPDMSIQPGDNNVSDGSYLLDSEKDFQNITVQNCGALSASDSMLMQPPTGVTVTAVSGVDGPDGTFYYIVTAIDPSGFETRRSTPEKSITLSGTYAAQISWNPVTGAKLYRVYRRSGGEFSSPSLVCTTVDTSCIDSLLTPGAGAPHINTETLPTLNVQKYGTGGQLANGTYFYTLTAIDYWGYETTIGPQVAVSLSYSTGTASVRLSWPAVPEASGYRIYRTRTSGLYNSPSLVCRIDDPAILECTDTGSGPIEGAPPRGYDNALSYGRVVIKASGLLSVDSTSIIDLSKKGYAGGASLNSTRGAGESGKGPGSGGDRGAGAGHATEGGNNSSGTGNTGSAYGNVLITTPFPGSGGASGSLDSRSGISGKGGDGGGAIKIGAGNVQIDGDIIADGEDGGDGKGTYWADGGGGGSGGSILISGNTVSITGLISATGGIGGKSGSSRYYKYLQGGVGSEGRIRVIPFTSLAGSINSNPTALIGNRGSYESPVFELDTGGVSFDTISWTSSVPSVSTLKFQIATSSTNDASTIWNFKGPDGTVNSYYTSSGAQINSIHNGDRYLKYRVFIESQTGNPSDSPLLYDVTINYYRTLREQALISSIYDTLDSGNTIRAIKWSENIMAGSDIGFQLRTSADGINWGPWYGPTSPTDTYTDPLGGEVINPVHRDGIDDRYFQYKLILYSDNVDSIPVLSDVTIDYQGVNTVYQPDGIIDGNGDGLYAATGSGGGGSSVKNTDPGVRIDFNVSIQNDGSGPLSDDSYKIVWNTPSDISGTWNVVLSDGTTDYTSPLITGIVQPANSINYFLKVTPSPNAPATSSQDIIIDIFSVNDNTKVDSIKATVNINTFYAGDGLIDGNGNDLYDAASGGGGGMSSKQGIHGVDTDYSIDLQNEGNIEDAYTLSLANTPPSGWSVFLYDALNDRYYDISSPSYTFTTPVIPPPPDAGSTVSYILKVRPGGEPLTADLILQIYSNGGGRYMDSLTARFELIAGYKVDAWIDSHGDNIYGAYGSGDGGFTSRDIPAGSTGEVVLGIQNESNVPDKYIISWNTPADWQVVLAEDYQGNTYTCSSPCQVPTTLPGNPAPSVYNPGEVPMFTFKITTPSTFTTGSETIVFDIQSVGDNTKADSVKAIINSSDTTPPDSVSLSTSNITDSSVTVSWTAPGDDGSTGTAYSYDLRYSTEIIIDDGLTPGTGEINFSNAMKVRGLGKPQPAGSSESVTISRLYADTDYYFAIKTSDETGNVSPLSTCSGCPAHTSVSNDTTAPGNIGDLSVTDVSGDTVTLCWTAPADDGTDSRSGPVTGYDLRYSTREIVDDGISPGVGQVVFSSALVATPVEGWLLPRDPGTRECYKVSVKNEIDTGGGVVDDRTRNTRFYFAIKALDEARNKSSLSNIAGGVTPLIPYAYNMVSVPYVPNPDTPQDVFGDDVGAQLYAYWWNSMGSSFDSGCYDGVPDPYSSDPSKYTCSTLTAIKEGLGYFLWVPQAKIVLDVPSGSTVAPTTICQDDQGVDFQCYVISLQEGWNMIGNPFDKEINFTLRGTAERGLYVRKTSGTTVEVATFQDAVTAKNWLDGSIYTYNGVNYTYEVCGQDNSGEPPGTRCSLVMQPWKAYWIRIPALGGATFELLIPK